MKKVLLALSFSLAFLLVPSLARAQTPTTYDCSKTTDSAIKNLIDEATLKACVATGMSEDSCIAIQCYLENVKTTPKTNQWWNPSLMEFSDKVFESNNSEIFGERYTYAQVNWIINSIFTMFLPRANKMTDIIDLFNIAKQLETGQVPTQLQPIADIFSFPFAHPIASSKTEFQNFLGALQIVPTASAQGLGYSKLAGSNNIRILWSATRNMAYLISIILLIATGFMVMFRSKINPQTVVTVQMILPKLAISLLLITFSLAIVGLVLDLVYVAIVAIVGFLQITGVSTGLIGNITTLTTASARYFANAFLGVYTGIVVAIIVLMLILQTFPIPYLGGLLYVILGILLALLIWAIISGIKIVVTLFQAYVNLIILTITGPLQIMMDIIPANHKSGFVPWVKCVIGNASVLVIAAILAIVAKLLFNFSGSSGLTFSFNGINPSFTLPFVGGEGLLLGDITQLGAGGGILLSWIFIPMIFFQAAPAMMNSLKNSICKGEDPSQQIADSVNNLVKQLTGKGPAQPEKLDQGGKLPGYRWWWPRPF